MPDLPIDIVQVLILLLVVGGGIARTIYQAVQNRDESGAGNARPRRDVEWELVDEIEDRPGAPDPLQDPAAPATRPGRPPRRAARNRARPSPPSSPRATPPPVATSSLASTLDQRFQNRLREIEEKLEERLRSVSAPSTASKESPASRSSLESVGTRRRQRARIAGIDARSALIAQIVLGCPKGISR